MCLPVREDAKLVRSRHWHGRLHRPLDTGPVISPLPTPLPRTHLHGQYLQADAGGIPNIRSVEATHWGLVRKPGTYCKGRCWKFIHKNPMLPRLRSTMPHVTSVARVTDSFSAQFAELKKLVGTGPPCGESLRSGVRTRAVAGLCNWCTRGDGPCLALPAAWAGAAAVVLGPPLRAPSQ
jgi:hypothetical protein